MTWCCVPGCSNRTGGENGYKLFRFPRNSEKRLLWSSACSMKRQPTDNDRICEGHFQSNLFEVVSLGGAVKLKRDAVPTIFLPNPPRTTVIARSALSDNCQNMLTSNDIVVVDTGLEVVDIIGEPEILINDESSLEQQSALSENALGHEAQSPETLTEVEKLKAKLNASKRNERRLREENLKLRRRVASLEKNLSFLQPDQLELVARNANPSTNSREWSLETIQRAIRIRCMIGSKAYEFLRCEQGFPLPSSRTLTRSSSRHFGIT